MAIAGKSCTASGRCRSVDGAGGWQRFRHITWPLLTPTTLFLLITLTITSFQGFDIVKIMTQGGPITSTMIYVYYIYEQAFQYFRLGKASAAVVILSQHDRARDAATARARAVCGRWHRRRPQATAGGGSAAPVMIATASVMLWLCGVIVAATCGGASSTNCAGC